MIYRRILEKFSFQYLRQRDYRGIDATYYELQNPGNDGAER